VLSEGQYRRLHGWLGSPLRRLNNLRRLLERLGYIPGDAFYDKTMKAIAAVHDLVVEAHYRSCSRIDRAPAKSVHQRLISEDVTEGKRRGA
jgi:hypothetical protein